MNRIANNEQAQPKRKESFVDIVESEMGKSEGSKSPMNGGGIQRQRS